MSYKVRTAEYNTVNLQDLGASLSQFIINPLNQNTTVTLTPTQLNNLTPTTPILILPAPGSNQCNVINGILSELIFNTGASSYNSAGPGFSYAYGNNLAPAGIAVDSALIINTISSIGKTISTGFTSNQSNLILGQAIYMITSNNPQFNSGTSNVVLKINYSVYTYP